MRDYFDYRTSRIDVKLMKYFTRIIKRSVNNSSLADIII